MTTAQDNLITFSHDNVITFSCLRGFVSNVAYVEDSFVITDGQPSTLPPKIEQKWVGWPSDVTQTWNVTVSCGRSGSEDVADQLNKLFPDPHSLYLSPLGSNKLNGTVPLKLNFFFTLILTISNPDLAGNAQAEVTVAQGSFTSNMGSENCWWLAGSSILNSCPDGSESCFMIFPGAAPIVATAGDSELSDVFVFQLTYLQDWEDL